MKQDQAFLLSKGSAMSVLEGVRTGFEPSYELVRPFANLVVVEGGFRGVHDSLNALCDRLRSPRSTEARAEFEAEGAVIVHKALRFLPDELIDDQEFWLWLTIYQCRDIVQWRHGAEAKFLNFGLEERFEGLLCRMFLRAHIVYSESDHDPYELARRGTQDFWRSFMIRRNYASVKTMARALARRVNYSDAKNLGDEQVRLLGPKITQLNSSYSYELLDEGQCGGFVNREADRLFLDAGN